MSELYYRVEILVYRTKVSKQMKLTECVTYCNMKEE
jgi:hypothetical protein